MKQIRFDRYGTPDVLELIDVPQPTPKDDEVLVKIGATSINDWDHGFLGGDLLTRMLSGFWKPNIKTLGADIAGRVEAVGRGVTTFRPGDEVWGDLCEVGWGGLAEYVCAPPKALALKPANMTFTQAAAVPQAGLLAMQGLHDRGNIQPDQTVLINGAGGGVGTFAVQIAKSIGTEVTAVDSAGKLDMLRTIGADHVIDYREQDFTASDRRYDLILDVKTNRSVFAYTRVLKPNGVYVTVGGNLPRLLQTFLLGGWIRKTQGKHMRVLAYKPNKGLDSLKALIEAGKVRSVIDGPYKLADAPAAFRHFGRAEHKGKVIVTTDCPPIV